MDDNVKKDEYEERTKVELDLDDLEDVAGGNDPRGRIVWCVDCGASYYAAEGHDCPDQ
jgi:hypothetical protein